jgi:thioredoxin 1
MLAPLVDEISKEYDGRVKVGKLNTDDNTEVATRFRISAIPTLLFFKGGKLVEQRVGQQMRV